MRESVPFTKPEGRQFGLTLGMAFVALTPVTAGRGHEIAAYGAAALSALLLVDAVVVPWHLGSVHRARFVPHRAGGNPVHRQEDRDSYWVNRAAARRSDLRRQV